MAAAARKDDKSTGEPQNQPGPAVDEAVAAVQHVADKAQEQGFYGVEVDPTDNHAYTLAGVIEGQPTPETDEDAAAEARKAAGLR
ncbi:hypothetical protein [Streptomyces sp. NPDC048272]|uniref:hypothetical protein n=1 Tax=Streptomyces sp. NPDC048272 TaxID=3154616 RepID=UPI00344AAABB